MIYLFMSLHQLLANVFMSPFYKISATARHVDQKEFTEAHTRCQASVCLAEPCSAERSHQWQVLQHLKEGLLPSLITWVHIFMLINHVHERDSGLESAIFIEDDYLHI